MTDTERRTRAKIRRAGRAPSGAWTLTAQRNPRAERANARRRGK